MKEFHSKVRLFAEERGWEQYHTPKNLSMALAVEAAELMEIFQWMTPEQCSRLSPELRHKAGEELADITIYALRLFDVLGLDPEEAIAGKMLKNAEKYPAASDPGME